MNHISLASLFLFFFFLSFASINLFLFEYTKCKIFEKKIKDTNNKTSTHSDAFPCKLWTIACCFTTPPIIIKGHALSKEAIMQWFPIISMLPCWMLVPLNAILAQSILVFFSFLPTWWLGMWKKSSWCLFSGSWKGDMPSLHPWV